MFTLGIYYKNGRYLVRAISSANKLSIKLYGEDKEALILDFDPEKRIGAVWEMELKKDARYKFYSFIGDGEEFSDPYGKKFKIDRAFGEKMKEDYIPLAYIDGSFRNQDFTKEYKFLEKWEQDRPLERDFSDDIIYKIHVRGFTKDESSGLKDDIRGTFRGVIEKISYLKSLGINVLELMPMYEFNEIIANDFSLNPAFQNPKERYSKINYWGFTDDALRFAPKFSYTSKGRDPSLEFKEMVYKLHENGIEVLCDFYFGEGYDPRYIEEVLKYWRMEYHIDGVHLIGESNFSYVSKSPYLQNFKIYKECWENPRYIGTPFASFNKKSCCDYNQYFQNDIRRVLKGDEDMVLALMNHIKNNYSDKARVNYIANNDGMTLMDLYSYERKHNELNGERNLDGTDYNFSWNCGKEGECNVKSVLKLRKRMIKNALILLFISQSIPLINAGDEFGRSKKGNNNSYCHDNKINYIDWNLLKKNRDIYEFIVKLIDFRKKHRVFHQKEVLKNMDYRSLGLPDISFHGENAWKADIENYRRQLGIMYYGDYADDKTFLILCNFYWEDHEFRIPMAPNFRRWKIILNTSDNVKNDEIYTYENERPLVLDVGERSIIILEAVEESEFGVKENIKYKKVLKRKKKNRKLGRGGRL